jgi:hypothetical protein
MTLLGHKTDIMFRKYIQRHDEQLVQAAQALVGSRAPKTPTSNRKSNGSN